MSRVWAIDLETFYTSKYSLKSMIAEEYCRDERFDAYLVSAASADGVEWAGHPGDFDWSQEILTIDIEDVLSQDDRQK